MTTEPAAVPALTEAQLLDLGTRAFRGLGLPETDAAQVARVLVTADLFGLSAHDIIGRRIEDVLPEGWAQIQPRLDRALGGVFLTFNY